MRGPVAGVPPLLQAVAHSLLQSREEVERLLDGMPADRLWRTTGAASIGFHVLHAIGSLDRLFTYACGAPLSSAQLQVLAQESAPDTDLTAEELIAAFDAAITRAVDELSGIDTATLPIRAVSAARVVHRWRPAVSRGAHARHVGQARTGETHGQSIRGASPLGPQPHSLAAPPARSVRLAHSRRSLAPLFVR